MWLEVVESRVPFYPTRWIDSLLRFHGCWQKSRDFCATHKGLYDSWHTTQHKHCHMCIRLSLPRFCGVIQWPDGTAHRADLCCCCWPLTLVKSSTFTACSRWCCSLFQEEIAVHQGYSFQIKPWKVALMQNGQGFAFQVYLAGPLGLRETYKGGSHNTDVLWFLSSYVLHERGTQMKHSTSNFIE